MRHLINVKKPHPWFCLRNPRDLPKVLKPLPPRSRLALSGFVNGRQLPRRDEVFDNLRWLDATFTATPGRHTLKLIMIDPEIVVEQIVVNPDNNHYSYFGNSKY